MPIVRTYMCPECGHREDVTLSADQWDAPPPACSACIAHDLVQVFKPPAIGGSLRSRAVALAEDIMANDYGVANATFQNREGGTPKVRYKDQTPATAMAASWGAGELMQQAVAIGKQTRRETGGDGLDILKRNLASGVQPDLIEASRRKAIRVW